MKSAKHRSFWSTSKDAAAIYATEADMLNVALFGKTAKEWRELNPAAEGNIRDFLVDKD
jgi:hypothetical protein